jgi:hypothetical protein
MTLLKDIPASDRAEWIEQRCGLLLEHAGWPCLVASALLIWLPAWWDLANLDTLVVLLPIAILALALGRAEPARTRARWMGVLGIAFVIRLFTLAVGIRLGEVNGLRMLGPDGDLFFRTSRFLALTHRWPSPDTIGSPDVAHYYLFSGVLRVLSGGLFELRLMNAGIDALSAACAFSICAMLLPSRSSTAGTLVAIHSPLVYVATLDFWKDPSAILALLITIWAVLRLRHERRPTQTILLALAAAVAFAYLRGTRDYWAFYLEAASLMTCLLMAWQGVSWSRYRRLLAISLLIVACAEAGPRLVGIPLTPVTFVNQVRHVSMTEKMRERPKGSLDDLLGSSGDTGESGGVTGLLHPGFAPDKGVRRNSLTFGLVAFRKVWGPYVWVMPPVFSAYEILRGSYIMFPGTLVWYALIPSIALALAVTILDALRRRAPSWPLVWLAVYVSICLAQYFALNLSFRQRDGMFPLLIVFGLIGWSVGIRHRWWWRVHLGYALMLIALAAYHLSHRPSAQDVTSVGSERAYVAAVAGRGAHAGFVPSAIQPKQERTYTSCRPAASSRRATSSRS